MKKKFIITSLFLLFSLFILSQVEVQKSEEKIIKDGLEYYLHTVSSGQTLFSISRAYNVSVSDISNANPDLGQTLSIDDVIKIPKLDKDGKPKRIIHNVKQGETLFSLLRKYNVSREDFFAINPDIPEDGTLRLDQKIYFPYVSDDSTQGRVSEFVPDEVEEIETEEIKAQEQEIEEPEKEEQIDLADDDTEYFDEDFQHITEIAQSQDSTLFIHHPLESGETIFSLSRKYDVPKKQILSSNPGIDEHNLSIGQIIRIPRFDAFSIRDKQKMIDSLTKINFDIPSIVTIPVKDTKVSEVLVKTPCDSLKLEIIKDTVNIAIMLPFDVKSNTERLKSQQRAQRELSIMNISERMISLFNGCLVGVNNYSDNENVNINVNVYDVGRDNEKINELIENGVIESMDIIIGPAFRSQIINLAENRPDKNTIIALPFSSNEAYLENYENVFLINTPGMYQIAEIVNFSKKYPDKNYIIIYEDTESGNNVANKYISMLTTELSQALDGGNPNVSKVLFDGTEIINIEDKISEEKPNVVILTIGGEYKSFRVFTQLFLLSDYNLTVIGSKDILEYETIDSRFLMDNNFTYYSSTNIDYTNKAVRNFVNKYRDLFHTEPNEYSFLGYDIFTILADAVLYYNNQVSGCLLEDQKIEGVSGNIYLSSDNRFANNSFSNSSLYLFHLNKVYGFDIVYPDKYVTNDTLLFNGLNDIEDKQ